MTDKPPIRIDDKDVFKPSEAAEIIGVSRWTVVNKYIHPKLLNAHKIGGSRGKGIKDSRHWRIWKEDLEEFLNRSVNIKESE